MCHHSERAIDWDAIEAELGEWTPAVDPIEVPDELTGESGSVEGPDTAFEGPDAELEEPGAELEEPDPETTDPAATDD